MRDVESVFKLSSSKLAKKDEKDFESVDHSNLIYVHFLFLYYSLLSPFRFKKVEQGKNELGKYKIHSWLPQKVLCGIAVCFGLYKAFRDTLDCFSAIRKNSPASFLKLFAFLSLAAFKVSVFVGIWKRKTRQLKLVNFSTGALSSLPSRFKIVSTTFLVLHLVIIIREIVIIGLGPNVINIWDWSPSWFYRRSIVEARYSFFVGPKGNFTTAPELSAFTGSDHFLFGVYFLLQVWHQLMNGYQYVYLLAHVWTLWLLVNAFGADIHNRLVRNMEENGFKDVEIGTNSQAEFDLACGKFKVLKGLSFLIGESIGNAIFYFFCFVIFMYGISFDEILLQANNFLRVHLILYYAFVVAILIFSAEIVRKIHWFEIWLCEECHSNMDQNKVGILLQDIAGNRIGIGAPGIVTITYSTLGTVGGLIITYFVIKLQSNN